jgi:hypothetical protein
MLEFVMCGTPTMWHSSAFAGSSQATMPRLSKTAKATLYYLNWLAGIAMVDRNADHYRAQTLHLYEA